MLFKKITMAVLILKFLNGTPLLADVSFDCITVDEGLSQSSVSAIAQDSVGFMWFGTRDGLNRYDGNRIKVYRQNAEQNGSLADNWITSLFTDDVGTLWIGGLSGAVLHFEAAADSFCMHPLPLPSQSEVMVLPNERMATLQVLFPYFHEKSVTAITGDGVDGIWV
ncbi:hypothetical protein KAH55_11295, partial [bacterium]|nr:hypothetical protein [bacterium]